MSFKSEFSCVQVQEALQTLRTTEFRKEDGTPHELFFHDGLSISELSQLEQRLGTALPADYRSLLLECSGIDGLPIELDFAPESPFDWASDVFPFGVPFAADGMGNFWIVDCVSPPEAEAVIFFDCHDPPITLYQGRGMAGFLLDLIPLAQQEDSKIDAVHEDEIFNVWGTHPNVLTRAEAYASGDRELKLFAEDLPDDFEVIDLRDPPVGMGYAWGRYGPDPRLERHGMKRIFAVAPSTKKPGFFARLFQRR